MSTAIQRFGQGEAVVERPDDRINSAPVDRWTLLHLASGGVSSAFGVPFPVFAVAAIWFEIVENVFQGSIPSVFPHTAPNDSLANATIDVAASMAAWAVVDALKG